MPFHQTGAHLARGLVLVCASALGSPGIAEAQLAVSTDFEGGSARIDAIVSERREIHIRPGGDPTRGWPCWWYLRIDGLADGEAATLVVQASERPVRTNGAATGKALAENWALPARATVSTDRVSWIHTEPGHKDGDRVSYSLKGTGAPLWVAWGPPFTSRECADLFARAVDSSRGTATVFELARSREGRPVRGLRLAGPGHQLTPAVWVHARQHAWESGSSWVACGLVDWLLGEEPEAAWLRAHTEVYVVPIVDVDRVATGDGGKESEPHDHNRDWSEAPFYPEVAATQRWLAALAAENRLALVLDLHNPQPSARQPFFFVPPADCLADAARANQARFLERAAHRLDAPLQLAAAPRITDAGYHPRWRQMSGLWVSGNTNEQTVAACLETPWNTPHSTTEGYRGVGAKLGRAVAAYVKSRPDDGGRIAPTPTD